jgi:hypothetical protein
MDFEKLMQANLDLVFGERDPTRRISRSETSTMKTRRFTNPGVRREDMKRSRRP